MTRSPIRRSRSRSKIKRTARMKHAMLGPTLLAIMCVTGFALAADDAPTTAPSSPAPAFSPPPQVALPPGMKPLCEGKTLDGWNQIPANSWEVKDGVIASLGVGRGVIYTTQQAAKYRIIFDIRHVIGNK